MSTPYRKRRLVTVILISLSVIATGLFVQYQEVVTTQQSSTPPQSTSTSKAADVLEALAIKGRAPKTGYSRDMFGSGWQTFGECDTRNNILARDMTQTDIRACKVYSGVLDDPYTCKTIYFSRGPETSDDVQIDHVVALSDAWQKGAQQLSQTTRESLANDPLELLAVEGKANQDKADGDAASWLPPNKSYRCRYVARQIAVKQKYNLWITLAEKEAMKRVLATCPNQQLPVLSQ